MDKEVGSAADSNDPGQAGGESEHAARSALAAHEESMARRESAVIEEEALMLGREKSASAREQAAELREGVVDIREDAADRREAVALIREDEAHLREGAATSREQGVRTAVRAHAVFEDQLHMLQQANANLVIASMEAHRLAEEIEAAKVELDHLAHHDVLTDLPNRMLLADRLGQAIEVARRQGRQLAVIYMDLDRFKHINDSLGHAVGDQLLKSVAQRLVACVRHSDTVSRQGGDEFVLLLPYIEHAEDAALSAQKILAALALPHRIDGSDLHISVSIGISIYPDDAHDADGMLKSADTAMYHAKESGRNNFKFFEPQMNARAVQRQSIEASLRQALDRHEFVLHYQPKINLQSETIVGVEALIRWQHPQRGLLLPSEFVPIAEDCGLILPIGRWVLREACLQAQAWLQAGLPAITMAVNTSALEFRAKDFLDNVRATLADTGLESNWLEVELTESVLMRDAESNDCVLSEIAELGVKLAIDDFGTGYSSLSYLRRFPINALKIDQSFVNQISANPDDAIIVSAVISMGKSLKQRVVAEGVETPEQYAFLRAQNCDEGQGYFFGRPMPAEALATLLHTGLSLPMPH
ncbi:MAG: EAL domain-containing protein [Rhodoferax sp.]|uniref:putative bifunctional diguanylate cyclase/phosphodiesterase n=1 Tax=Rhodoferax sp. TaxID=50421 RepID=UPI00271DCB30|nr:EAL domain-containing protein [Rhodoferax sp.]MDO8449120.1 EAL domain-containing protein [Rhodoferax sp.]